MDKEEYQKYLNSEHWKQRRKEIRLSRKCCEDCGSYNNLQVHHLSYKHLWTEPDEDLKLLCQNCHKQEHGIGPISFAQLYAEISGLLKKQR